MYARKRALRPTPAKHRATELPISKYRYDNPDDAYQEALRRIKKAKNGEGRLFIGKPDFILDLSHLGLTIVPPETGYLPEMTEMTGLHLYTNQLTSIPPEIFQLPRLIYLYLAQNQLTIVPSEIGLLQLKELDLKRNQLTTIPPEIGQLTERLRILRLGQNRLTTIPSEIKQLKELMVLELENNRLETVPPSIWQLTNLRNLDSLPLEC